MYQGSALSDQQRIILTYAAEKGRGYADAKVALAKVAAIADPTERDDAEATLVHDMDEAADLEKVSKGYIRGWRLGLDDWHIEQATRMDGVSMMPITESKEA